MGWQITRVQHEEGLCRAGGLRLEGSRYKAQSCHHHADGLTNTTVGTRDFFRRACCPARAFRELISCKRAGQAEACIKKHAWYTAGALMMSILASALLQEPSSWQKGVWGVTKSICTSGAL